MNSMKKGKTLSVAVLVVSLGFLAEIPTAWSWSNDHGGRHVNREQASVTDVETLLPAFGPEPRRDRRVLQSRTALSRSYGIENIFSELSKEVAGKVFYEMKDEGQHVLTSRVAVVSAVPLSDLKRETEFGRMVAEFFLTDLADRGILVEELRLGKDVTIVPQAGEFILSQNIGELANEAPAIDYVVVSTFTNTSKTLILQGRMIAVQTGLVVTSWRYNMPLNQELITLLGGGGDREPFAIAVKGPGERLK